MRDRNIEMRHEENKDWYVRIFVFFQCGQRSGRMDEKVKEVEKFMNMYEF